MKGYRVTTHVDVSADDFLDAVTDAVHVLQHPGAYPMVYEVCSLKDIKIVDLRRPRCQAIE